MADSSFSGSSLFVTGTFPFTNNHFIGSQFVGSAIQQISGSFLLTGTNQDIDGHAGHHVDSFSSGVVEQITITGHAPDVQFYVERHILVTSGILPA